MTIKHTPGPWTIHKDYSRANYTVFDADGNYGDTSVETIDANAALIAAAPDLLQALNGMLQLFADTQDMEDYETVQFARAAVYKAVGA